MHTFMYIVRMLLVYFFAEIFPVMRCNLKNECLQHEAVPAADIVVNCCRHICDHLCCIQPVCCLFVNTVSIIMSFL